MLHVPRLGEVKIDCLAQGLAEFLHVSTGSETAGQFKNFGPQLFARLVVERTVYTCSAITRSLPLELASSQSATTHREREV
jgi:hypothetical protein